MKHYGDITKINGASVPVVDVITGGSPCQDLSVAGKREGLDGARSGLFMEQIRIVKEMRENDRKHGRTGVAVRPRYMVWENVPGAFSSNGGEDFRIVLEEITKISDETAVIPRPAGGGRWTNAGCIVGNGFSIAWRVHDAQFWGVPQRRKRIALVADFGGLSAPEILFEREGLRGNFEQGETQREKAAASVEECAGNSIANTLTRRCDGSPQPDKGTGAPIVIEGNGTRESHKGDGYVESETMYTLNSVEQHALCAGFSFGNSGKARSIGYQEETSPTIRGGEGSNQKPCVLDGRNEEPVVFDGTQITSPTVHSNPKAGDPCQTLHANSERMYVCHDARGNGKERTVVTTYQEVSGTLSPGAHAGSYNGQDAYNDMLVLSSNQNNATVSDGVSPALPASAGMGGGYVPMVSYGLDRASFNQGPGAQFDFSVEHEKIGAQTARGPGAVCAVDCRNGTESETNGTLQSKPNGGTSYNLQNVCRTDVVRRLTPLECERLQGFPDGWTDIGEWTDTKGKKHKYADSPRYKALGNSIALPFWQWLARRICAQYERDITMASLFDGISGFPLVFARAGCKPVWTSEIDEFQIAVCKKHFGDETQKDMFLNG